MRYFTKLRERKKNKYFSKSSKSIFFRSNTIFFFLSQGNPEISLSSRELGRPHLLVSSRFKMRRFGGTRVHRIRRRRNPPGWFLSPGKRPNERTNADRFGETRKVLLPPKVIAHTAVGRFAPTKIDGARADNEDGPVISRAIPLACFRGSIFGNGPTTVELSLAAIDRTFRPRNLPLIGFDLQVTRNAIESTDELRFT